MSMLLRGLLFVLFSSAFGLKLAHLGGQKVHFPAFSTQIPQESEPSLIEERSMVGAAAEAEAEAGVEAETEAEAEAGVEGQAFSCVSVIGRRSWYHSWARCPKGYTLTGVGGRQTRRSYDWWSRPSLFQPTKNAALVRLGWGSEARARCCKIPRHTCYTQAAGWRWGRPVATCKSNYVVVGGGMQHHHWPWWRVWWWWRRYRLEWLRMSAPNGERSWEVQGSYWMKSWARCCNKRVFGKCQTVRTNQGNWVQANCPSGKIVVGGGWRINYPWHNRYQAFEDSWAKGQTAWVVDSGYGYGWSVAYARCCVPLKDVDLCKKNAGHGGCDKRTKCKYDVGSYSQTTCGPCPLGYTGTGKKGCKDINECLKDNGDCDPLTKCQNTEGSRKCSPCPSGYVGDGYTGCEDIDECEENNGDCDKLTQCHNKPGSYTCTMCPSGYEQRTGKKPCVDINECKKNNGGCDPLTKCKNVPGSRKCTDCPRGYTGNGADSGGCEDKDECAYNNGGCDLFTVCINTAGSFKCSECPAGFVKGTGIKPCKDVNECLVNNGGCHPARRCINQRPGSKCEKCGHGYQNAGPRDCADLDECRVNNGGCDPLTKCYNIMGSRKCGKCPFGYEGTGNSGCKDYNECTQLNGQCHKLTTCTNTPGSRICGKCPPGYRGDGYTDCVLESHFLLHRGTSKLDIAKMTAKSTVDLSLATMEEQKKEQDKDQAKMRKIRQRGQEMAHLEDKLIDLKWGVKTKENQQKQRYAALDRANASIIKREAEEKVTDLLTAAFEGRDPVDDDDSKSEEGESKEEKKDDEEEEEGEAAKASGSGSGSTEKKEEADGSGSGSEEDKSSGSEEDKSSGSGSAEEQGSGSEEEEQGSGSGSGGEQQQGGGEQQQGGGQQQ